MKMYELLLEIHELERLGVIYRIDEPKSTLYLIIPRDLSKDNVRDNIERIKSYGIRVFSKIKGVDEYYNMNGKRLDRNKPLTEIEQVCYARQFLREVDLDNKNMINSKNELAGKKLFSLVTKEELEDIQEHIKFLQAMKNIK